MVSRTAARWMADGNTSLDDCEAFTSSFGCTGRPEPLASPGWRSPRSCSCSSTCPSRSGTRRSGNWSSHWPLATSAAASWMAAATSSGSTPSSRFTIDAAPLIDASAPMSARSIRSPEIGKLSTARCVCAPHRAAAGTRTSPIVSCSMRNSSAAMTPTYGAVPMTDARLHRAPAPRPGRHAVPPAHHRRRAHASRPPAARSSRSSPRRSRSSPARRSATSPTGCGPPTSQQLRRILDDPEASANDRFVALDLLKNANIAAGGVLPMCQDTGTAIVMGKRGERVLTGGDDERAHQPRHPADLRDLGAALLADGAAHDVGRAEHRHQPAGPDRALRRAGRRLQAPVHGQGRRLGQQELPVPGDQGGAEPQRRCCGSSTRSCARSAPRPARRTTSPSSSAARRRSSR